MTHSVFIDGLWLDDEGRESLEVVNPFTETVAGTIDAGTVDDVDRAVQAAVAALPAWRATPPDERAVHLRAIAQCIEDRAETFAELAATDVGTPLTGALSTVAGCSFIFRNAADLADALQTTASRDYGLLVREPVGVVAAITPWNYPLYQATAKIASALAAGCTVVLKPSEVAPLSVLPLADVTVEAGLPAGVFNMVNGLGPVVGEALVNHPDVDMVSLTGSVRSGARVAALAAASIKKVTLELGGKSANVVLPGTEDIAGIVTKNIAELCSNAGQTCAALTRLLVPRELLGEAEEAARSASATLVMGDPLDAATTLGPIVSSAQFEQVRSFIDRGIEEGARLVRDDLDVPPSGYFVPPTVFTDVTEDMTIAQEEIFGPVLCLMPYDDVEQAIRIANGTRYGLSGSVWAPTDEEAIAVARRLETGQVRINGSYPSYSAPFGGIKHSGIGRELGSVGFDDYMEWKVLFV